MNNRFGCRPTVRVINKQGGCWIVHVETPLGLVNIYTGLTDRKGRPVERVSTSPDQGVRLLFKNSMLRGRVTHET